ncbi:hypothetical protein [Halopiger xanaduensis]|uniref:Uncharacterized protein n=1 Tax=Halopiger xanaduensis (strain DSM 18323 / JCM 14033 / SH-6) TaxID=797210 RepID=F8D899_HALXS|nr:hypothetical protein [Halopiger xanaduensis]AEH36742.1 hypothetical protein Halxa_2117 [Halopiger xanaduensis SH-6]
MDSRRSLLRTVTGLVTGGTALFGAAGAAARSAGADASDGGNARGATTVAFEANRTAIRSAGRPATLAPVVETLERRFEYGFGTLSLADFASVSGTGRVADGDLVGGTVVATGSIAADAVGSILRRRGFVAVGERNGVDRYAARDGPFAVGVADSAVVVGYETQQNGRAVAGRSDDGSPFTNGLARVDTVVRQSNRAAAVRGPASASSGSPAAAVGAVLDEAGSGDLTVTAALDAGTRAQIRSVLADGRQSLAPILERAAALGASVSVDPEGDGRSEITYGLVGDEALSVTTVREGLEDLATDAAAGIDSVSVEQCGQGVAVNADVATESLLEAQLAAAGLEGAFDGQSVVGR